MLDSLPKLPRLWVWSQDSDRFSSPESFAFLLHNALAIMGDESTSVQGDKDPLTSFPRDRDAGTFSDSVDGGHRDFVFSVWNQSLEKDAVLYSGNHNLSRKAKHNDQAGPAIPTAPLEKHDYIHFESIRSELGFVSEE